MPLGYLGYLKLAGVYLLANSAGLNRVVNPLTSSAVWGAGWYTAPTVSNYADSQQNFEGSATWEMQGIPSVWNLIRDWMVERRVYPQSIELSPNGLQKQSHQVVAGDPRSGAWMKSAAITIDAEALITMNCNLLALTRVETTVGTTYEDIRIGPGLPTGPLNPSPVNMNPIPGWMARTNIVWPDAPPIWTTSTPNGFVMQSASLNYDNNTVVIKGCTGDRNPVAIMQGTMTVSGDISLWRNGIIPDPYGNPGNPFTASNALLEMSFGAVNPLKMTVAHLLLESDSFQIAGPNSPVVRTFGFMGLGNGQAPPFQLSQA